MLGACEKDYLAPKKVEVTEINTPVSFATDILPILTTNCAKANCHLAGAHSPNLSAGSAYDELGVFVNASAPTDSRLYKLITGTSTPVMPPAGNTNLTSTQIGYILAWIQQGAQNN